MSALNDGGPAFPRNGHPDKNDFPHGGMSLRDYFAGQALAGMLASPQVFENMTDETLAAITYSAADAMLKERERRAE